MLVACWWARLIVASTLTVQSTPPLASASATSRAWMRSQVPSVLNRLCLFHTVCQGPKDAGRRRGGPRGRARAGGPANRDELRLAAAAVAAHRGVLLQPASRVLAGYGQVAQAKWAAWRRKERLEAVADEFLDDQIARVAAILDPIFGPPSTQDDL